MKEIVRVHLAKTGYDIEVEAKKALASYLEGIERAMGSEEVMYEIEARMVELLAERGVAAGSVITKADVAALREQMGEPQEFFDGDAHSATDDEVGAEGERPAKRLMRDPDNALLGGVCAGLGAYWGINPLWVRLLFIISPFITVGVSILIYLVLWVSMPEAQTAAEKLQMRGKAVTFDALKQMSVSEETKTHAKVALVKTLQIFVTAMLLLMTLGLLAVLIFGMVMGTSAVVWLDGFRAQGWAWGLLASLVLGGAAAVTMSGVLTSMAARWKVTKTALVAVVVSLVIGALSASSIALFGVRTANELAADTQRFTKVMHVDVPQDLQGLTRVDVRSDNPVHYESLYAEKPRIEVRYFDRSGTTQPPKVTVRADGEVLRVEVDQQDDNRRCGWQPFLSPAVCLEYVHVRVYGPFQQQPAPIVIPDAELHT